MVLHREFGPSSLNDSLAGMVRTLRDDPSVGNRVTADRITTVGGFQPDVTLHKACAEDPAWRSFMSEIVGPSVGAYLHQHCEVAGWPKPGSAWSISASWAVVYPAGAYQAPHLHRDISFVLTYYAQVPARPRPEGAITFINPHVESTFPARRNWGYDRHYFPRAGTCLVFPAWLQHFAHPHFAADEERLMFSLDIVFDAPTRDD